MKTLWDMKVTVIPVIVGALGTVLKNLEKRLDGFEIRGRIDRKFDHSTTKIVPDT